VTRRYSHFESLREKLLKKYPFEAIPILPEKDWLIRFSTDNSQQVKDRMNKLQYFLTIIVINPVLNATQEVCDFLIDTDEHFFDSEFVEINLGLFWRIFVLTLKYRKYLWNWNSISQESSILWLKVSELLWISL